MKTLRRSLPVFLLAGMAVLVFANFAQAQIPPRQPIFLNNNASLYTFPNPNFGLPSQLPFAFVAVAHEDCRLFNNGAMLMPQVRLMAAECQQGGQNMPPVPPIPPVGGPIGICPRNGELVFPAGFPRPPGTESTITCPNFIPLVVNGANFNRAPMRRPIMPPAYVYGGAPANYYGNYGSYQPSSPPSTLSTAPGSSPYASTSYAGFGTYTQSSYGKFLSTVGTEPLSRFGFGVSNDPCCGSTADKPESKDTGEK